VVWYNAHMNTNPRTLSDSQVAALFPEQDVEGFKMNSSAISTAIGKLGWFGTIMAIIFLGVFAVLVFTLTIWLLTITIGAGFQTLGIDGPGWQTVGWFTLAFRLIAPTAHSRSKT
jgi:hypothetical protein